MYWPPLAPLLDEGADERLYALLGADFANPIPPHPPNRRWAWPPVSQIRTPEWQRIDNGWWSYTPWPERRHRAPHREARTQRSSEVEYQRVRRMEDNTAQKWGYRDMGELQNDARLFCYGIGSRYFNDVYRLLREELVAGDPLQAEALDMLVVRLAEMRDRLQQMLPTATGAPIIPGESEDVSERAELP